MARRTGTESLQQTMRRPNSCLTAGGDDTFALMRITRGQIPTTPWDSYAVTQRCAGGSNCGSSTQTYPFDIGTTVS